jgi:hypothetical protein
MQELEEPVLRLQVVAEPAQALVEVLEPELVRQEHLYLLFQNVFFRLRSLMI